MAITIIKGSPDGGTIVVGVFFFLLGEPGAYRFVPAIAVTAALGTRLRRSVAMDTIQY
jgi:hypothetical protein